MSDLFSAMSINSYVLFFTQVRVPFSLAQALPVFFPLGSQATQDSQIREFQVQCLKAKGEEEDT